MAKSLLPSNAKPLERDLEATLARIDEIPIVIQDLWNPWKCPAALLPWLAWTVSVDVWDSGWSEYTKRQVVASSIAVHRRKGSVWSVKEAVSAAIGQTPSIIEGLHRPKRDGSCSRVGHYFRGWEKAWAMYRCVLPRPITNAQVAQVRAILKYTAPARSHLLSLDYREAAIVRDGAARRDGSYNRGVA